MALLSHSEAEAHLVPDAIQCAWRMEAKVQSSLAPLIRLFYKCRRLRGLSLKLCEHLEGGGLFSQTLRQILRDEHDVEVGRYTYGPVLVPGVLPRGSSVGNYCSIGPELSVYRRDHPAERVVMHPLFYNHVFGLVEQDTIPLNQDNPLEIGNDTWIGGRVTILRGCRKIGNGAVVAAGSIVSKDVAPYSIVGGVPAKLIRMRFPPELITRIEESQWWLHNLPDLVKKFPDLQAMGYSCER